MKHVINIKDVVADTIKNEEGLKLFQLLNCYLASGNVVYLSLKNANPMSSSFMNSSFGEVIDKYGLDVFKSLVKIQDYKASDAILIKDYINRYSDLVS